MHQDEVTTNWEARLYDDKHSFVSKYGEDIIPLLGPLAGEHILDLGCGTGDLAAKIASTGAIVTGVDSSEEMIAQAKEKYPDIAFRKVSATEMDYTNQYDAVFSNAALHWIHDQPKTISNINKALKHGGRFVFEMGAKNNVKAIIDALHDVLVAHGYTSQADNQLWYFPSLAQYASLLEQHGFSVSFARYFKRPTELKSTDSGIKDWLRMFGNSFFYGLNEQQIEAVVSEVQERVKPSLFKDGKWYADYWRLRMVAVKM